MDEQVFRIENIYVPAKRRKTLDAATVGEIAASIMEEGQKSPILVRRDGQSTSKREYCT